MACFYTVCGSMLTAHSLYSISTEVAVFVVCVVYTLIHHQLIKKGALEASSLCGSPG